MHVWNIRRMFPRRFECVLHLRRVASRAETLSACREQWLSPGTGRPLLLPSSEMTALGRWLMTTGPWKCTGRCIEGTPRSPRASQLTRGSGSLPLRD